MENPFQISRGSSLPSGTGPATRSGYNSFQKQRVINDKNNLMSDTLWHSGSSIVTPKQTLENYDDKTHFPKLPMVLLHPLHAARKSGKHAFWKTRYAAEAESIRQ